MDCYQGAGIIEYLWHCHYIGDITFDSLFNIQWGGGHFEEPHSTFPTIPRPGAPTESRSHEFLMPSVASLSSHSQSWAAAGQDCDSEMRTRLVDLLCRARLKGRVWWILSLLLLTMFFCLPFPAVVMQPRRPPFPAQHSQLKPLHCISLGLRFPLKANIWRNKPHRGRRGGGGGGACSSRNHLASPPPPKALMHISCSQTQREDEASDIFDTKHESSIFGLSALEMGS